MVKYLKQHANGTVSRRDLARHFNMTPEHVNLLFRKELKATPTEIVNRERCHRAWQLLQNGELSVKEVADQVGFHDPFYFSRVFKKVFGVPPSSLR